jgi:hypothetical protein
VSSRVDQFHAWVTEAADLTKHPPIGCRSDGPRTRSGPHHNDGNNSATDAGGTQAVMAHPALSDNPGRERVPRVSDTAASPPLPNGGGLWFGCGHVAEVRRGSADMARPAWLRRAASQSRALSVASSVRPRIGALSVVRRCRCLRTGDGEQLPVAGYALELMDATVCELDA